MIEPTVSWGSLLTVASVIIAALGLLWKLSAYHAENAARLSVLEDRVESIWQWFWRDRRHDDYKG